MVNGLGVDVTSISQEQLVNFSKIKRWNMGRGHSLICYKGYDSRNFHLDHQTHLYSVLHPPPIHSSFSDPKIRIVCYAMLGINVVFAISVLLAQLLICRPLLYFWDQSTRGSCGNFKSFYLFIAVFNLITDITIFVLPLPILWLQMARSRKLALIGIFGMGIVCGNSRPRNQMT